MSRPTGSTLTTAGFTNVSGTKYTKAQGSTATDVVELGNTGAGTGVTSVTAASGQPAVSAADLQAGLALHVTTGAHAGGVPSSVESKGLQYYGITV
jgi:hypothetical protein